MLRAARASMRPHAGFSMIEALVATVVLSFGLLALAGFQLRVLSDSVGASNKNVAVQLAGDIADRIRVNRVAGAATDSPYRVDAWTLAGDTAPSPSCTGATANCSAAQLAAQDMWNWKRAIAQALPGGQGNVAAKADAGGLLFVHVAWDEPSAVNPILPDPGWACPAGKACQEVIVAVPQP